MSLFVFKVKDNLINLFGLFTDNGFIYNNRWVVESNGVGLFKATGIHAGSLVGLNAYFNEDYTIFGNWEMIGFREQFIFWKALLFFVTYLTLFCGCFG